MWSFKIGNPVRIFHKTMRNLSNGDLVLHKKPVNQLKNKTIIELALKKRSQKVRKKKVVKKKPLDDFEDIWLKNLTPDNLRLYRKTSFGSFRRINENKLLEKLKVFSLSDNATENKDCFVKLSPSSSCSSLDSSTEKSSTEDYLAPPHLSDFLIKNMTSFPLLKTYCSEPLKTILKDENDNYGFVDSIKLPSVTRILSETMSKTSRLRLDQWKKSMIEKLGENGFCKHQKDPELSSCPNQYTKVHIKTGRKQKKPVVDLLNRGAKFHSCLKSYLESGSKDVDSLDPEIKGCWNSLEKLLPDVSNVMMVEESLHHPVLMYKGVVDCVASYRNVPCVIEWKKSDKKKSALSATYDAPLQLCAYLGALAWNEKLSDKALKNGLVVVAYTDGTPANVFLMDLECCEMYWTEWLRRLQSYWESRSPTIVLEESE